MKIYLFICILCHFCLGTSTKIKPELKKNILNFGYCINYKYEGMLMHSFDRFYIVTKFILPSLGYLKFSNLNYDTCAHLDNRNTWNTEEWKYMLDLWTFCKKIDPFVAYYKRLIESYNNTMYNFSEREINLLLPQIPRVQKCGIITTLVSNCIGLVYEVISSFLHNKSNKALHKAISAMDSKADIQYNKLMHLKNSMLMYGICNAETLEKLIKTVHNIHNTTTSHERLFAGQHSPSVFRTLYVHSLGLHHYSINSLLYLRNIQDKYLSLYRELIAQLHMYASAIRIWAKDICPIL